jgi:hypothetical protein
LQLALANRINLPGGYGLKSWCANIAESEDRHYCEYDSALVGEGHGEKSNAGQAIPTTTLPRSSRNLVAGPGKNACGKRSGRERAG